MLAPLLKEDWLKSYLDDIIYAPYILLQRLDKLFKHMTSVGIKLNLSKFNIGQKEIKFFVHIVSNQGYRPDPCNTAVQKMKPPSNVKEVRRFLGIVGFYRKHIEHFSKIAIPITDVTKKDKPFVWSPKCQEAFEALKR